MNACTRSIRAWRPRTKTDHLPDAVFSSIQSKTRAFTRGSGQWAAARGPAGELRAAEPARDHTICVLPDCSPLPAGPSLHAASLGLSSMETTNSQRWVERPAGRGGGARGIRWPPGASGSKREDLEFIYSGFSPAGMLPARLLTRRLPTVMPTMTPVPAEFGAPRTDARPPPARRPGGRMPWPLAVSGRVASPAPARPGRPRHPIPIPAQAAEGKQSLRRCHAAAACLA